MSKSKNWKAVLSNNLVGNDPIMTISGEINTGGIHTPAELAVRKLQGIVPQQLLVDASPIADSVPEQFVSVNCVVKLSPPHPTFYSSVLIFEAGTENVLAEITKFERIYS